MISDRRMRMMESVNMRLKEFLDNEACSGLMDFACIKPLYAYLMFVGQFSMEAVESGLAELRKQGFLNIR